MDFEPEYDYEGEDGMDLMNYDYYPHEGDYAQPYISFLDITKTCAFATTQDIGGVFLATLGFCFLFQVVNFCPVNEKVKHFLSGAMGLGLLYYHFKNLIIHCLLLPLVFYSVAGLLLRNNYRMSFTSILMLAYLSICEFTFEDVDWGRIRNVQMLLVMKIMSLVMDYEKKEIENFPPYLKFFGYVFCLGNCIFGPWIDYKTYLNGFQTKKLTINYLIDLVKSVIIGYLFFLLSMCYVDWLAQSFGNFYLFAMYGKALEFRAGHFFVMYMSSCFNLAAGFRSTDDSNKVTNPSKIEFPHSLVEVVVYWNIPMHRWLKHYVFKPLQVYGNFVAVIGTYFVSSLLHGLNYQLSAILLSLAVYTYVEYVFRRKLSNRLNACVASKSCKPHCDRHRHTERKLGVHFINLLFTFVALYHLSYLGFLLDSRTEQTFTINNAFERWQILGYQSHYVILITYIISLVL